MEHFICLTVVLLFAVAVSNVQSAMESSEESEKFEADVIFCKNQTAGVTDADLEDLYSHNIPTTKPGKCFTKCILNRMEIFKDGKFSADGLIKIVQMEKSNLKGKDGKSLIDSMKDIVGECTNVTDPDECELAAKIRICLNAAAKKREFCPNIF